MDSHPRIFLQSFFEKLEDRVLFDGVPDAAMVLPEATNTEPAQVQNVSFDQSQLDWLAVFPLRQRRYIPQSRVRCATLEGISKRRI